MIYGYIRAESQRREIGHYAKQNGIAIDQWTENINRTAEGDIVIASELSQLGRDPLQALDTLKRLLSSGAQVWAVKDGYRLGGDATGKALALAFGLSADIKRSLISRHTREAMACIKADGRKLGRPAGKRSKSKLAGRALEVHRLLSTGLSQVEIARKLGVSRSTLAVFLSSNSFVWG